MKKLVISFMLLLIPLIGLSQIWEYQVGETDYNGKYEIASTIGIADSISNDSFYNNPIMIISHFDNIKSTKIYIANIGRKSNFNTYIYNTILLKYGYYFNDTIIFKFNKTKKIIKFDNKNINNINDTYFFKLDYNLLNELKINNYVTVIVVTKRDRIVYEFSLYKSKQTINKVMKSN